MKAVLQRVSKAEVAVDGQNIGKIGPGMVVLIGIEEDDDRNTVENLIDRLLQFRIFSDDNGQMNHDLSHIEGDLMLIPNFTLCADTGASGHRPGFGPAASPDEAENLFLELVQYTREKAPGNVATGEFGAMMDVGLVNDGPVTFTFSEE